MVDKYFACTLIGEARGEPIEGQIGVGFVIRNRAIADKKSYRDICLAPKQFSCWNINDPNFKLITKVLSDLDQGNTIDDPYFRQSIAIARCIQEEDFLDNTKGAKNYVTKDRWKLADTRKDEQLDGWINRMVQTVILGNHIFLRER